MKRIIFILIAIILNGAVIAQESRSERLARLSKEFVALFEAGKQSEAMSLMEAEIRKDPSDVESYIVVAQLCESAKFIGILRGFSERGLKLDPNNADLSLILGNWYFHYSGAYSVTLGDDIMSGKVSTNYQASIYRKFVKALAYYQTALRSYPENQSINSSIKYLNAMIPWMKKRLAPYLKECEEIRTNELAKREAEKARRAVKTTLDLWVENIVIEKENCKDNLPNLNKLPSSKAKLKRMNEDLLSFYSCCDDEINRLSTLANKLQNASQKSYISSVRTIADKKRARAINLIELIEIEDKKVNDIVEGLH